MQYYTFEFYKESQELCVIITPVGKYKHICLPMGLKCAPNLVQQILEQVLHGLGNVKVYLDDIGVFGTTRDKHQVLLDKVLSCLKATGFTINPLKCAWAIQEFVWLRYWLKSAGRKPWKKWISAILEQEPPCNLKEMQCFLGTVNSYWLMWLKQAHLLTPLSDKSGKKHFIGDQIWTKHLKS